MLNDNCQVHSRQFSENNPQYSKSKDIKTIKIWYIPLSNWKTEIEQSNRMCGIPSVLRNRLHWIPNMLYHRGPIRADLVALRPGRPGNTKLQLSSRCEQVSVCLTSHRCSVLSSNRDTSRPCKTTPSLSINQSNQSIHQSATNHRTNRTPHIIASTGNFIITLEQDTSQCAASASQGFASNCKGLSLKSQC